MTSLSALLNTIRPLLLGLVCACLGGGCAGSDGVKQAQPGRVGEVSYEEIIAYTGPAAAAPWAYHGAPGFVLSTPHYRLFTTSRDEDLIELMPLFIEQSLNHYRSEFGLLPAPIRPMESYLFEQRGQWEDFTRRVMGSQAGPYLNISRGGFAVNGIGVFYELSGSDTYKIAAHEGWHQFSQTVFRDSLPDWVEEGVATYMEGHRVRRGQFSFAPWSNPERFFQIHRARRDGLLLPLDVLLQTDPEDLLSSKDAGVLNYYAQVWLLIHYLQEWDDGKYRRSFADLLSDACNGTLDQSISKRLSPSRLDADATGQHTALGSEAVPRTGIAGIDIFRAYFNTDLEDADTEYRRFISQMSGRGAWRRMMQGRRPSSASGRTPD